MEQIEKDVMRKRLIDVEIILAEAQSIVFNSTNDEEGELCDMIGELVIQVAKCFDYFVEHIETKE